jgi:iron complex transport system ATP-binding protein
MSDKIIEVNNLSKSYGDNVVLNDISFSLPKGEIVGLFGPNGCGKSTLLKSLTGEIDAISGSVEIDNTPLKNLSNKALSQLIAIVTTERVQAGGLKVEELVSLGRHPHTGFFGKLSQKDKQIAMEAMRSVGIYHKKDSFTSELSDGERQKMMIARAIAQQTPIIILDEPFSFLDTASRIEIFALLKKISRDKGVAILLSSHDVAQSMRMSDRIIMIDRNRNVTCGTPSEIIQEGNINNLFDSQNIVYDTALSDFIPKN